MKTGDSNRDSHMLEVLGYPESKEIVFSVTNTQVDKDLNYKISGDLIIKGKSKPIVFLAKLSKEGSFRVNGSFEILLSDYSVERPALLFVPIKDSVRVEVEISI
jgi:polyisoprenoid-binding protein YceI